MRSTQEKFIQTMDALAQKEKLDLVIDYSYSNIGTARFQKLGTWDSILDVNFNFQAGYASISIDGDTHHYCEYSDGEKWKKMITDIRVLVEGRR